MQDYDAIIVGAGIAGLSLAWHLTKQGQRVCVLDRNPRATGASVRNLGMIWVVGQLTEELQEMAFRSAGYWQQLSEEHGFWFERRGSLTLAYEDEEQEVLREYLDQANPAAERALLAPAEVLQRVPQVNPAGLRGGLWSPTEGAVDPREAVHVLAQKLQVEIRFDSNVAEITSDGVTLANNERIKGKKVAVCAGPDIFDLFPKAVEAVGLIRCRLQMLRLRSKQAEPLIATHLCAGLTLSHYPNFRACPGLGAVKSLHQEKWRFQLKHGIHVLVAQHPDGTLTVGDSHEYGRDSGVYRSEEVDDAILEAMNEFLPRDRYRIVERWDGYYNTHPSLPYWMEQVGDSVWLLNLFGTGMTLSFAVTKKLSEAMLS